ncbi:Nonsense-mediated mRNA decay protein [Entamoeba marina]
MAEETNNSSVKCQYCGISGKSILLRCSCGKYFCNGVGEGNTSHIVHHLAKSKHKELKFSRGSQFSDVHIECHICKSRNPFILGYINLIQNNNTHVILCRECRRGEYVKQRGWDPDSWAALIQEKRFLDWVCSPPINKEKVNSISINEMRKLEFKWSASRKRTQEPEFYPRELRDTFLNYHDCEQYREIFLPLIKLEARDDQKKRESEHLTNVKLEFPNFSRYTKKKETTIQATFEIPSNEDIRITTSDSLFFVCPMNNKEIDIFEIHGYIDFDDEEYASFLSRLNTFLKATVKSVTSDRVTVEIQKALKIPPEKQKVDANTAKLSFIVAFEWLSIPFHRKKDALRHFAFLDDVCYEPCMSTYLKNRLLGTPLTSFDNETEKEMMESKKEYLSLNNGITGLSAPGLPRLNQVQAEVVESAFSKPLSLIQGPPGTGKTVTSATLIYNVVRSNPGKKVLVAAPSNIAVDQLGQRILATGVKIVRVYSRGRDNVDSPLFEHSLTDIAEHKLEKNEKELYIAYKKHLNDDSGVDNTTVEKAKLSLKKYMDQHLQTVDVILTTCCVCGDKKIDSIRGEINTVLIDESTQADEPECLVCLRNNVQQLFLVGDHCQLGPILNSKEAKNHGLVLPMFSRLLLLNHEPYRLQFQYRMHPSLSEFPSHTFYDGVLQNGVTALERQFEPLSSFWYQPTRPMMFIASNGKEGFGSTGTSYLNDDEVRIIEALLEKLLTIGVEGTQIGVITPYIAQKQAVVQACINNKRLGMSVVNDVEIASVDSFQGREKDFIIFSTVRSNSQNDIGFLKNPQRLNVSITRAKYGLIIVGNPNTLVNNPLWAKYLQYFIDNNALVHGPLDKLVNFPLTIKESVMSSPIMYQYKPKTQFFSDVDFIEEFSFVRKADSKPYMPMSTSVLNNLEIDSTPTQFNEDMDFTIDEDSLDYSDEGSSSDDVFDDGMMMY